MARVPREGGMTTKPRELETVDITGQVCPAALLISLRRIHAAKDAIRAGEKTLVILTDSRDSVGTITDAVENMGYRVETRKEGDHYSLAVTFGREGEE
jgi:TusA-related sulfurtransferase